jgi:hypothetical protein
MRFLTHTVLFTVIGASAAWAADPAGQDFLSNAQTPAQTPTVTVGPVYAYGPIVQSRKPRQRNADTNGSNRNRDQSRRQYGGLRTASPYPDFRDGQMRRPWQWGPPPYSWNSRDRYNSSRYNDYQRPGFSSQNANAFAWPRQNYAQGGYRQPYWRY